MNLTLAPRRPLSPTGDMTKLSVQARSRRRGLPVALVSMPFVTVQMPSLQLGLLNSIARSHGFPTETYHLYLDFAARIGTQDYEHVAVGDRSQNMGEWLFSVAAFGDRAPDPDGSRFIEEFITSWPDAPIAADRLLDIRANLVDDYLDHLVESVPWGRYSVVGFTSTFQQTVASLALARRLKQEYPDLLTLFGGANFDAEMGLEHVRRHDQIDLVLAGEADTSFPALLIALAEERPLDTIPGLVRRTADGGVSMNPTEMFDRMDELPVPDYSEFFDRAITLGMTRDMRTEVPLPVESSRGCWWGAKRHCTFCGLNANSMTYRSKSADTFAEEVLALAARHRGYRFQVVDNILDLAYMDELFPQLADRQATLAFFFEVKANLSRHDVQRLSEGGVYRIQPGIESLSSFVLGLMRKGVRSSTNVNLLRWATYYGIIVSWNVLYGFPGEREEHYDEMAELCDRLHHLQAPNASGRIWLERFSPNYFDEERFPKKKLEPMSSYSMVYPGDVDLGEIAYFFDYEFEDSLPDSSYKQIEEAVDRWIARSKGDERPSLTAWISDALVEIEDRRDPSDERSYSLRKAHAIAFRGCFEGPAKAEQIAENAGADVEMIRAALETLVDADLVMRDGNLYLALPIPVRIHR